jgi:RHS repeat-associated protein
MTRSSSNVVQSRTRINYRYDTSRIRFIAIDSFDNNLSTTAFDAQANGRIEYLIDHANMTGYGQTIIETEFNATGQATKRTSFTFGTDEITQNVATLNASGVVSSNVLHVFGHNGHGSTRVLFDAAAVLAQVYTYTAYGELISIHRTNGTLVSGNGTTLADPTLAATRQLYNGEAIDNRTGLYNNRDRWLEVRFGRFVSHDRYAGNPNDPFSFHKYGFVHGDPIGNTDPTGKWSLGGLAVSVGIGIFLVSTGVAYFGFGYTAVQSLQIGAFLGVAAGLAVMGFGAPIVLGLGAKGGLGYLSLSGLSLYSAMKFALGYSSAIDESQLFRALKKLDSSKAAEAESIASAIAATFNSNWRWEWQRTVPFVKSERAKGYFCYEWAYAFEDAFNASSQGGFIARVKAAKAERDSDGDELTHYWLEISSANNPSEKIFVDDGFWDGNYIHEIRPSHPDGTPPSTETYLPVDQPPVPRNLPGIDIPKVFLK